MFLVTTNEPINKNSPVLKILAFDTSGLQLSVAILSDDKIIKETLITESGKHVELLIPEIENILNSQSIWYQDIGLIATTKGPGSFTGVRIGLACARTLHLALQIPLILSNSLEVIAFQCAEFFDQRKMLIAVDAGANEIFVGEFFVENEKITELSKPQLVRLEDILNILPKEKFLLCGNAKNIIKPIAEAQNCDFEIYDSDDDFVSAGAIGLCAYKNFLDGVDLSNESNNPLYLRFPNISERKK